MSYLVPFSLNVHAERGRSVLVDQGTESARQDELKREILKERDGIEQVRVSGGNGVTVEQYAKIPS